MDFDWDEEKRLTNLRKHGIDFADVHLIFEHDIVTDIDERFDYGEIRYLTLGMLGGEIIAVSHTENDETFRIISARKAEKYEQEIYFSAVRD